MFVSEVGGRSGGAHHLEASSPRASRRAASRVDRSRPSSLHRFDLRHCTGVDPRPAHGELRGVLLLRSDRHLEERMLAACAAELFLSTEGKVAARAVPLMTGKTSAL